MKYDDYPYTGSRKTCKYDKSKATGVTNGYYGLPRPATTHDMKYALSFGPVSIAVDASSTVWNYYKSGIVSTGCGTNLDHGVLAVGWGKEKGTGKEYVLVKNQWSTGWGWDGYIKLALDNGCGLLENASFSAVIGMPVPQG